MPNVLTPEELADLLLVPTTVEQAKRIKVRNQSLLDALERGEDYEGHVGCPHCSREMKCVTCAWQKHPNAGSSLGHTIVGTYFPCIYASFGGVMYDGLVGVGYDHNSEEFIQCQFMDRERVSTFLRGHIEWAEEVIKRGGTK